MEAKQRLTNWFNDPNTPTDAWKTWKLREIAEASGVSQHTVSMVLPGLVMEKYPVIDSYAMFKRARAAYRRVYRLPGAALPDKEIEDIQHRRREGGSLIEIATETGYAYRTVVKYCKGIKRGKKKR